VVRCAVRRELGAVESFRLKVGVEASCHNVGEYRIGGCVQAFAKGRGGFAAPSLTTDCSALKDVIVALLWFSARRTLMVVSSLFLRRFFPVGKRRAQNLKAKFRCLKQHRKAAEKPSQSMESTDDWVHWKRLQYARSR
jgi:hypothetical protein